jgi:hypothetical protein
VTRKPPAARTAFAAALLVLALVLVPTAVAGKGGGHGGGGGGTTSGTTTFKLVPVNPSADGLVHWGQQVTFDVYTTATSQPNVDLTCTRNSVVIYGATTGFYAGYPWPWTQVMTLSSQMWTGGDADCTALLYYFYGTKKMALSTIKFHAYA